MTRNVAIGLLVPALLFAGLYFPALAKLSIALVSPYGKADVRKRLFAAILDAIPIAATLLSPDSGPVLVLIAAAYMLLRDSVRGQSLGKLICGLVVVSVETGQPCGIRGSVWRNGVFLLPGANLVAMFLEPLTIVRDPQGQRLGDKLAQTQVVEGLGARDLAAAFQRWWRGVIADAARSGRRSRERPVDVRREV